MPDEEILPPEQLQALTAEIRADEHAARARDFGEPDAASYEGRVAEGAANMPDLASDSPPSSPAEMERAVSNVEQSFDQMLDEAAARMPASNEDKGRDR